MWPNPQKSADLVTFTEGILNEKLHSLCSDMSMCFGKNPCLKGLLPKFNGRWNVFYFTRKSNPLCLFVWIKGWDLIYNHSPQHFFFLRHYSSWLLANSINCRNWSPSDRLSEAATRGVLHKNVFLKFRKIHR